MVSHATLCNWKCDAIFKTNQFFTFFLSLSKVNTRQMYVEFECRCTLWHYLFVILSQPIHFYAPYVYMWWPIREKSGSIKKWWATQLRRKIHYLSLILFNKRSTPPPPLPPTHDDMSHFRSFVLAMPHWIMIVLFFFNTSCTILQL